MLKCIGTFSEQVNKYKILSDCCVIFFCQIIDPFVEVEIIGLSVDCCKEQTRVVDDNGELGER